MKINRLELKNNVPVEYEDDIVFKDEHFNEYHVKDILDCHVKLTATEYGDFLSLKTFIKCKVLTMSAYSLKDVELPLKINEEILITDKEELKDIYYFEKLPIIDIDHYIFSLIISSVPAKVVDKNEELPSSGEGYRILKEDDFYKEKSSNKKSPFDVLDNLDLD